MKVQEVHSQKKYFKIILILGFLISGHLLYAQHEEHIREYEELKNTIIKNKYDYKNGLGETLNEDAVQHILARDAEASRMWKKGKTSTSIGTALMVPGIAAGLGIIDLFLKEKDQIMSTEVRMICIIGGTALFISGTIIVLQSEKKRNAAVELYNENRQRQKLNTSWEIKAGVTNSGNLGFVINF